MDRESILKLADILGVRVGSSRGANIVIQCPLAPHSREHASVEDATPSFSILIDDDGPSPCNCFGCSARGTLLWVLTKAQREYGGFEDALEFAKRVEDYPLDVQLDRAMQGRRARRRRERTPQSLTLSRFVRACQTHVPGYALDRGLTDREIAQWMIGLDPFDYRMTLPVWDRQGSLVGVVGRSVFDDREPRYLSYFGFQSGEYLYGEHSLDFTLGEGVLVEGPIDTIVAKRYHANALGLIGLKLTPEKRNKLKKWFDSVTLLLDADTAGSVEALSTDVTTLRIGVWLSSVLKVYVGLLPPGTDPASAPEAIPHALENRVLWDALGLDTRIVV